MREWLLNLLSVFFNTTKMVVRKNELVTIDKLNQFLKLLPSQPMAKVVDEGHHHYLVEFRVKMPRKRATKSEKKQAKRGRTWAGGKMPSGKLKVVSNNEESNSAS